MKEGQKRPQRVRFWMREKIWKKVEGFFFHFFSFGGTLSPVLSDVLSGLPVGMMWKAVITSPSGVSASTVYRPLSSSVTSRITSECFLPSSAETISYFGQVNSFSLSRNHVGFTGVDDSKVSSISSAEILGTSWSSSVNSVEGAVEDLFCLILVSLKRFTWGDLGLLVQKLHS